MEAIEESDQLLIIGENDEVLQVLFNVHKNIPLVRYHTETFDTPEEVVQLIKEKQNCYQLISSLFYWLMRPAFSMSLYPNEMIFGSSQQGIQDERVDLHNRRYAREEFFERFPILKVPDDIGGGY
ncbi:hypothetical protein [Paenibacillus chitinolyticus]